MKIQVVVGRSAVHRILESLPTAVRRMVLVGVVALGVAACTSTVTSEPLKVTPEVITSVTRYQKEYVLAPGDQVEVNVYRHPELSVTGVVRPDGYISMPLLDDVLVNGLTVPQADARLTKLLGSRLVRPEVAVIVKNAREPMVYVFGEVGQPRPVPFREAHTVAQAIGMVGGLKQSAAKDKVAVIRLNDKGQLVAYVVQDPLDGQPGFYMALQGMPLRPDDLIVVPESKRSQFVRFIQDYINAPMGGINQMLTPYFQYKVLEQLK